MHRGVIGEVGGLQAISEVVLARDGDAAPAATGGVVPAVVAGVLPAVDAEAERAVECLELLRGDRLLLGAHRVPDGVAERILAHDVVLQTRDEAAGLAQRVQLGRGLELVARPAPLAE